MRSRGRDMTILKAPTRTLSDGVVELRLPSPEAGDIATIDRYVEDEQLDGGWLPDVPLVSSDRLVENWLNCWNGRPSGNDATFTFVVTVPDEPRFVGVVGVAEGDDGAFDVTYGTAPGWRGRGLASRATRLVADWAARQPSVRTVETLIDEGQRACERVAVNAGFVLADTMTRSDPGTGDTVQLRYIMERAPVAESP
jgi:RimJ/RimL family protein N-acetyltransferase